MKMNTWLISVAVVMTFVLLLIGCAPSQEMPSETKSPEATQKPVVELKMSHFMSPKHVQHTDVMVPFAEEVEQETDGRVKITIYPGGSLGSPPEQYNAAVTGVTDIAFGLHCYTPGKFPLTSVMELPFMVHSAKQGSQVLWQLYQEFPEIRAEHEGVKVLWLWTHDTGQLLTVDKPVHTMDDLEGMKLRCPAVSQKAMIQEWGATPVMMPISELYESLQKGVVDGTVVPFSAIYDFNLNEVANYVTVGDFYVCTFFMVMNKDSWNRISAKDQKIIEELIGKRMSQKAAAAYDHGAELGIETCKKADMEIYTLSEDELVTWENGMDPIHDQWVEDREAEGLPGEEVHSKALELAKKYE